MGDMLNHTTSYRWSLVFTKEINFIYMIRSGLSGLQYRLKMYHRYAISDFFKTLLYVLVFK